VAKYILIASQDEVESATLGACFAGTGYRTLQVSGQDEIHACLREKAIDLVIVDLELVETDQFHHLRALLEHEALNDAPVIIIGGGDKMKQITRCIQLGATDYLTRPLIPVILVTRLRASIVARQLEDVQQLHMRRLEALHREMDEYSLTMAHDVRSPIATLNSFAQVLLQDFDSFSREEMMTYLGMIHTLARKAGNIVEALSFFASIRLERPDLDTVDMNMIVKEVVVRIEPLLKEKNGRLEASGQWPNVVGYRLWIEKVWSNLVSNAIKFSGETPVIELGVETATNRANFWVKDRGTGVAQENQEKLFQPFALFEAHPESGYGLGLATVKRIVERLGGEVWVESAAGEGSTFYFSLPLAQSNPSTEGKGGES
jgi:signal transduction histidine kinase